MNGPGSQKLQISVHLVNSFQTEKSINALPKKLMYARQTAKSVRQRAFAVAFGIRAILTCVIMARIQVGVAAGPSGG